MHQQGVTSSMSPTSEAYRSFPMLRASGTSLASNLDSDLSGSHPKHPLTTRLAIRLNVLKLWSMAQTSASPPPSFPEPLATGWYLPAQQLARPAPSRRIGNLTPSRGATVSLGNIASFDTATTGLARATAQDANLIVDGVAATTAPTPSALP